MSSNIRPSSVSTNNQSIGTTTGSHNISDTHKVTDSHNKAMRDSTTTATTTHDNRRTYSDHAKHIEFSGCTLNGDQSFS